jgi:DNA-directed RNA polymerase subunit RPC12/RpoP
MAKHKHDYHVNGYCVCGKHISSTRPYMCITCKQQFEEVPLYKLNECPYGHDHMIIKKSSILKRDYSDPLPDRCKT